MRDGCPGGRGCSETWNEKIRQISRGRFTSALPLNKNCPKNFWHLGERLGSGSRGTLSSVEQGSCSGHRTEAVNRNFCDLADLRIFHHSGELLPAFPRVLFVPQGVSVTRAPHWGGWICPGMGWDGRTILLDEGAPSITCSHPRGSWSSSAVPFLHKAFLGVVAPFSHSRRSCQDSRKPFQGLEVVVLPLWCLKVC